MFTKHNNFIFDWDGVFADTRLDFQPIRDKYFGGERVPLLEAALALPDPGPLMDEIRRLEIEGAERAVPVEGAVVLAARLVERARLTGRPWCIVSRNCRDAVERAAKSCGLPLPPILLTRDDGPVKPDPRALEAAAALMGVPLDDCTVVGDSVYDLWAAQRAGIQSIIIGHTGEAWARDATERFDSLAGFMAKYYEEP